MGAISEFPYVREMVRAKSRLYDMSCSCCLEAECRLSGRTDLTTLNGAQAFVECLKDEGVEFVFSVSGGQTLSILDALYDVPSIRHVTARHETAAAVMADAYGRLTGRPAVVIATTGPGATNLPTGVGNAHRDSTPMIVVTCNNNFRDIGYDEAQDADHVSLMRQFVKSTRFVGDPTSVVTATREAFRVATSGNPGPAHIDFARDAIEKGELTYRPAAPGTLRATAPAVGSEAAIAAMVNRIAAAERPVIWAGRGVVTANAQDALIRFAEAVNVAVITTYNGIGAFPGRHDLSFGPRSRWGGRPANAALAKSDLVIAIGNSLNSITTSRWTLPLPHLVQIDCDPLSIGKRYAVEASVLGDARDALDRMAERFAERLAGRRPDRPWLKELHKTREDWRAQMFGPAFAAGSPIKPQYVMRAIAEATDDDAILAYDAGNAGIWSHMVPVQGPRNYMKPVGFGAMGFALPAAIGARLTQPGAAALAIVGDGALSMSLCEIETAARENAPVVVIVLNDRSLGNIRQLQLKQYGQRHIGVDYGDIRFADAARAMGGDGERVTNAGELIPAIRKALKSPVPYVIDVVIDPRESIWDDPF